MYPDVKLLIDNVWCDADDGRTLDVLNPATGERIGSVAHATTGDLDRALAAAERGFTVWSKTSAHQRSDVIRRAAGHLRARADDIARLMTLEQGKPLAEAKGEVVRAAETAEWFAEEARRIYGRTIPPRGDGVTNLVLKLPVGPVAAFTPWNFPVNQLVKKMTAGLAAGCSVIAKAPEETPASTAAMMGCFVDAGLPAGVVALVFGTPAMISEHLIPHPVIRKVSFTGSTPVGRHLAAMAGQHLKRITLELGGHAPAFVFADADLDRAVAALAGSKFRNAGQVCISPTRFLVEEPVYDRVLDGIAAAARKVTVGDGMDPATQMGPLANPRRVTALEELVADAVDKGARLVTGGERIGNRGFFFAPTVLADVPDSARVMTEEPFGPLAIVNRFAGVDAAIAEGNRTEYGLASYAFTGSARTMQRLSHEVACGMMTINHIGYGFAELPFGGVKASGYGVEGGSEGIEAYLDTRLVTQVPG